MHTHELQTQNSLKLLGHLVLFVYSQFCYSLFLALEIFLDSDLLSIEDQGLMFIQLGSHKHI